jgi:hypothetical protein
VTPVVKRLRGAAELALRATRGVNTMVSYQVTSHDPQVSADDLKAMLTGALTTSRLEKALRLYAVAYNVQPMADVTVSAAVVHSEPNAAPPTHLSSAAVTGAAMAAVVGVLLLATTYFYLRHSRRTKRVLPLFDSALDLDAYLHFTEADDDTSELPHWGAASG